MQTLFLSPAEKLSLLQSNMRLWRLQKNITQQELAARAGVSLSAIRMFEQQKGNPSLRAFMRIADALGTDEDILQASEPKPQLFTSIKEVVKANKRKPKQRRRASGKRVGSAENAHATQHQ